MNLNLESTYQIDIRKYTFIVNGFTQESYFFSRTGDNTQRPLIVILHGSIKNNGYNPIIGFSSYYIRRIINNGVNVFAPISPGFCSSEGDFDYNGRFTQQAITKSISLIIDQIGNIDKSEVALHGFSLGANLACLILFRSNINFKCVILQSGVYDQNLRYSSTEDISFKRKIEAVTNMDKEELKIRTPINYVHHISSKVLILHGSNDKKINFDQSILLSKKLSENGITNDTHILEGGNHRLNNKLKEREDFIDNFLTANLLKTR